MDFFSNLTLLYVFPNVTLLILLLCSESDCLVDFGHSHVSHKSEELLRSSTLHGKQTGKKTAQARR
jgi:hypothetical protein